MVEIRWLVDAKSDLKAIFDYISEDSRKYATRQIQKLKTCTGILKSNVYAGKVVPEIGSENIREITEGHYRIIYRIVTENVIHILYVHHGARHFKKRLE